MLLGRVRFRNEDHEGHFGEHEDDDDDDGAWYSRELEGIVNFGGLLGTSFDFKYGGCDPEDFYIARLKVEPEVEVIEPVPEPGTMTLMGAGLLGLVSRARRRTRS